MNRRSSGFTIFELMIALAIVAILASIAIPSYTNHLAKAEVKEAQSNIIAISLYAQNHYQRKLAYPVGDLTHAAFGNWSASSNKFTYTYNSAGASYTITATGASGSKVPGCDLTLKDNGVKTIASCGSVSSW